MTGEAKRDDGARRRMAELLRELAVECVSVGTLEPAHAETTPRQRVLAKMLWDFALGGDLAACRLLLEYMEGKPVQPVSARLTTPTAPVMTADELGVAQAGLLVQLDVKLSTESHE